MIFGRNSNNNLFVPEWSAPENASIESDLSDDRSVHVCAGEKLATKVEQTSDAEYMWGVVQRVSGEQKGPKDWQED